MDYANLLTFSGMENISFLHQIYKALSSKDLSAGVLTALKGMCIFRSLPAIPEMKKDADKSSIFRKEGNDHFSHEHYPKALECYNKALLFAPKGSLELTLALSNRSAIFFKVKAYFASFEDIETCLKLECSANLLEKLNKRKISCLKMIESEISPRRDLVNGFPEEFFKFNEKKHPEIPCLSADIDIISVSGEKKVVASKEIKVGTVVAVETAFATHTVAAKALVTCYFCQKMTFHLIPCDNCCYALFCSTECQKRCVSEYHDIECQIITVLETINASESFRLIIKTVLKLIKKCKTWSKLIEESNISASVRLNSSSLSQIYNVENYSSILCFKENHHFIHGTLFNGCFVFAIALHSLEKIPGFFPESPIDLEAKKCFANLCMRLVMICVTEINSTADNYSVLKLQNAKTHLGLFSLVGKLNHSCDPNVLVIGLNNRVGLVAVKPIKKMTEITISKIGHFYDRHFGNHRAQYLYENTRTVCSCHVCRDSWGINLFEQDLTPQQKIILIQNKLKSTLGRNLKERRYFEGNCLALSKLEELVNTKEHLGVYSEFRSQLKLYQHAATLNSSI